MSQIKDDLINMMFQFCFRSRFLSRAQHYRKKLLQLRYLDVKDKESVQTKQCIQQGQVWSLALRNRHALVSLLWLLLAILPRLLSHGAVKRHSLSPDRPPPSAQDDWTLLRAGRLFRRDISMGFLQSHIFPQTLAARFGVGGLENFCAAN